MPPDSGTSASNAVLSRLSGLHPRVIDLSLVRIQRLLAALGRPETLMPPVVHVAGTNGKGSTIAFLRAILGTAGLLVHVYTSPHLVRFNERIVVAGREIEDSVLVALLEACEEANQGQPITIFEIITAAALLAFSRTPADFTLLETGLGGRLDATNVVARPAITAITPISRDHESYLGNTIAAIAFEKAGILKEGVPCVVAAQHPDALAVIRERAAALAAPLIEEGRDWSATSDRSGRMEFATADKLLALGVPGLRGRHQVQNAGVAVACALHLPAPEQAPCRETAFARERPAPPFREVSTLRRGLEHVKWPARLQRIIEGDLAALLPQGWELWLDGGHNPGAALVLARHLAEWQDRPVNIVVGMLRSKDADAFLSALAPAVSRLVAVPLAAEENGLTADEVVAIASRCGIEAKPATDVGEALRALASADSGPCRVLICGSLYLAGSVLAMSGGCGGGGGDKGSLCRPDTGAGRPVTG